MTATQRNWIIGIACTLLVVLTLWWMTNTAYNTGREDQRAECTAPHNHTPHTEDTQL